MSESHAGSCPIFGGPSVRPRKKACFEEFSAWYRMGREDGMGSSRLPRMPCMNGTSWMTLSSMTTGVSHWIEDGQVTKGEPMTIEELCKRSHDIAVSKGWHEQERSFGEVVALFHSEVSEALGVFQGSGTTAR